MGSEQPNKGNQEIERAALNDNQPDLSSPSSMSLSCKENAPGFIPPHGGYQNLISFQKAEIVYDATVYFCARFLSKRDRTYDQMVQAARSGKQNIVEGSQVSGTSKELEIKLTGRDEHKLRVGDIRIIYEIDDKSHEVVVLMIDDRKQVYRRLRKRS